MIDDGQLIRSSENGKMMCKVMGKSRVGEKETEKERRNAYMLLLTATASLLHVIDFYMLQNVVS